jgi:hypothetical protein
MYLTGKNIYIQQDWSGDGDWHTLAASKSCEIKGECEEIEIASPDQGEWYKAIAGRKKLTINFSYLVTNEGVFYDSDTSALKDIMRVGSEFKLRIDDGPCEIELMCMLKSINIVATNGSLAQGSIQFVSIGTPLWS